MHSPSLQQDLPFILGGVLYLKGELGRIRALEEGYRTFSDEVSSEEYIGPSSSWGLNQVDAM